MDSDGDLTFLVYAIDGWLGLFLTIGLTVFILHGMRTVPRLSVKWKRVFIVAQTYSLVFFLFRVTYFTMQASNATHVDEDTGANSFDMWLCSIVLSVGYVLCTLTYAYYVWFWFIRLEITFERSKTLAISKFQKYAMNGVLIEFHVFCVIFFILPLISHEYDKRTNLCAMDEKFNLISLILTGLIAISYPSLSFYLCVIYIKKLKAVMIQNKADKRTDLSITEKLTLRKTTFIAITSIAVSGLLLALFTLTSFQTFVTMDLVSNVLFIACYFRVGKPLYDRVFCLCEKHGNRMLLLCDIDADIDDSGLKRHKSIASKSSVTQEV